MDWHGCMIPRFFVRTGLGTASGVLCFFYIALICMALYVQREVFFGMGRLGYEVGWLDKRFGNGWEVVLNTTYLDQGSLYILRIQVKYVDYLLHISWAVNMRLEILSRSWDFCGIMDHVGIGFLLK
jgi:hypothetical protein